MQDISISIVLYHNENDIYDLVNSIEKYTRRALTKTIYLIDNASEPECYQSLCIRYPDVKYFSPGENLGFGQGHNYIIEQLNSRYHVILNPDVILIEDTFSKLISFMDDITIGMCVPRLLAEDGNILKVYRRIPTIFDMGIRMFCPGLFSKRMAYATMQEQDYSRPFQVPFVQGSFLMIRTNLFKHLGGFDNRYFMYMEDADLCRRVNEISKLMYCPCTSAIHKWKRESHKNKKLFKIHVESMLKYFIKWNIRG